MEAKEKELKQAEEFGMESEAIAQAKVCRRCCDSFKAEIREERKAGIKEVVEWIEEEDAIDRMERERWQAQLKIWFKDSPELLKEWGIK